MSYLIKAGDPPRKGRKRAEFPAPITEGQRQLQTICVSQSLTYDQIVKRIGAGNTTLIMGWLKAASRPNNEMRAKLYGEFNIPPDAWNVAPLAHGAPPAMATNGAAKPEAPLSPANGHTLVVPPLAPVPAGPRPSTLESCLQVLDTLRAARAAAPNLIASEAIKLADAEGRMLALRARLERDNERTEDRLVREHPEWQRLKRLIVRVLTNHPAALKDLAAALGEELEAS